MNGRKPLWYLFDSNIFLRLLLRDNERMWQDCVELFKAVGDGRINAFIPSLVVAEVQFVLFSFYGFERPRIATALKSISVLTNLRILDDLKVSRAIELYEKKNVKFIDCYLASSERVRKSEAIIVSYDRDFDRLEVQRLEPVALLKELKK